MTAQVIYLEHFLTPHKRRVVQRNPATIYKFAPKWDRPFIALLNGRAVLRADWGQKINHGDVLAFVDVNAIPQGGGDGIRSVLRIAVAVVAAWATQGASIGVQIAGQIAINTAGNMLINAILPPPTQQVSNLALLAAPSPTYSVQAQGNTVRLEQAIPEHFGRLKFFPDFAAQPYVEYAGNEQYLYQLLAIGRGQYAIEQVLIEKTDISNFNEIAYEVIPPGGAVTLFPSNVETSAEVVGQSPECVDRYDHRVTNVSTLITYVRAGDTITVTWQNHGLTITNSVHFTASTGAGTTGTYLVATVPTVDTFTITDAVSGPTSGNAVISVWVGGFIATLPNTAANYLAVDYVMNSGMYSANANNALSNVTITMVIEVRTVDNSGLPTGAYTLLGTNSYTAATTTPQRYSVRYAVTPGMYQVRVRRSSIRSLLSTVGNAVAWAGLRAYLPETRNFGDVTLMAMRMRASNNISAQISRKINVVATRKLPIWNGTVWSAPTATRSIAWPIAYACKQVGLTDAQIDLAALLALDTTWAARLDYFDGRFDGFITFWEAVTKMGQAGRAKPYMQGGVMRIMRDQAASIPVALFSVRNIAKGSFKINYLMPTPSTADAVDVGYFDKNVWASRRVRATLPGSSALLPAKIELFGVVERDQAFREGMYQGACNRYRRKAITFDTEMEGFIPSFGDLIAVQHDMPSWGQGGEVIGWNAGTNTATLSENPTFGGGTNYIAFRKLDGSVDGPYPVTSGGAGLVVLASAPAYTPYTGLAKEKTHYSFGSGAAYMQARVVAVKPSGLHKVTIDAINEDGNVHTADTGVFAPPVTTSTLSSYTSAPVVTGLIVVSAPFDPMTMLVSWQPSPWASMYLIEQSSDGSSWTRVGETASSSFTAAVLYGNGTLVRVAASGSSVGAWSQVAYAATISPVPDIGALNAVYEGTVVWLNWNTVSDPRPIVYEVRCGASWGSGMVYQVGPQTRFKVPKDGEWWVCAKLDSITYPAYAPTPKAIEVIGAVMVANVVSVVSEQGTGWAGTKDRVYKKANHIQLSGQGLFSAIPSVSTVPGIADYGGFVGSGAYTLPTSNIVDLGISSACQVSAALDYSVEDTSTLVSTIPLFSAIPSLICPIGGTGSVALEMNLAQTDGAYTGWQPFVPGTYLARLFNFRAVLTSTGATVTPIIRDITTTVDVPDRIDSAQATTPAGAITVAFATPFRVAPKMQITVLNAVANDDAVLSGISSSGFTLTIKNGGADVARDFHWLAQGY